MNEQERQEFQAIADLKPDQFVLPGRSENGSTPVPGIVFTRDKDDPGIVYYADVDLVNWGIEENNKVEEEVDLK